MSSAYPWSALGLTGAPDERAIRRAYAARLKAINPDTDPEAFQQLMAARNHALAIARSGNEPWDAPDTSPVDEPPLVQTAPVEAAPPHPADVLGHFTPLVTPVLALREGGKEGGGLAVSLLATTLPLILPPLSAGLLSDHPLPDGEAHPSGAPALGSLARPVWVADLSHREHAAGTIGPSVLRLHADGRSETSEPALTRLLLDHSPQIAMTDEEAQAADRHLDIILSDPRMHDIRHAADVEFWLADIFAQSTPRSDPFVQRLADQFGWRAEAGTIGQRPAVAWLTDRAVAFDFRDKLSQPDNAGYKAWVELTTPAFPGDKRGKAKHVHELIQTVRKDYPALEGYFDPYRLTLWDKPPSSSRWFGARFGWGLFALLVVVRLLIAASESPSPRYAAAPPSVTEQLTNPITQNRIISDALRDTVGNNLSMAELEHQNPTLVDMMRDRVESEQSFFSAETEVKWLFARRLWRALESAPRPELTAYRRAQSNLMKRLAESDAARCLRFDNGEPVPASIDLIDVADPMHEAAAAMLVQGTELTAEARRQPRQFQLLESTINDAARRASLSEERFTAAFTRGEGSERDRCLVRAALIDALLAAPQDAETLDALRRL